MICWRLMALNGSITRRRIILQSLIPSPPMPIAIKICGLSTPGTLDAALDAGADFVGFVNFPKSPRHVEPPVAAMLAEQARGKAKIVCLTVDAGDDLLDAIVTAARPDYLQLHGSETPARVGEIVRRQKIPAIKAVKVATRDDVAAAEAYRHVAAFVLFDAKADETAAGKLPGGNGIAFDWRVLDGVAARGPFMLSGGLDASTVAQAIRLTGALMVDVSSGVESAPGIKDIDKIYHFIQAVKK
jgi:phosphoribosylanthranilate isomerase